MTRSSTLLQRLDDDHVLSEVSDVLLAACGGDDELDEVIGGGALVRPERATREGDHREPAGAYLTSVTVSGFRGIGSAASLQLAPGPGLTLVIGRNGSGKSSFAEALEILVTGSLRPWEDRSSVWREGWRNLHDAPETAVIAQLVLEDLGPAVVERRWPDGANLDEGGATVQVAGEKRVPLERLGWERDLAAFRPFLSHAELEAFLGRPSELHDILASVLGLEELSATLERLAKARLQRESVLSAVKKDLNPQARVRSCPSRFEKVLVYWAFVNSRSQSFPLYSDRPCILVSNWLANWWVLIGVLLSPALVLDGVGRLTHWGPSM